MKQRPRRKALIISTVILLVLIGGATFVSYRLVDYPFAAARLDKEWDRAVQNGIPLSAEELKPSDPVHPRDNAAIPYERAAVKIWQAEYQARSNPKPSTKGLTREQFEWQRDQAILSVVGPYLYHIEEGARKPGYWYDRDYDRYEDTDHIEFGIYKKIGTALATRAETKARAGDVDGAIKDLELGFRFAQSISKDPTISGCFASSSVYRSQFDEFGKLTTRFQDKPLILARLRSFITGLPTATLDLKSVIRADIYTQITTARNIIGIKSGSDENDSATLKWQKTVKSNTSGKPSNRSSRAYLSRTLNVWNDIVESKEWKSGDDTAIGLLIDKQSEDMWRKRGYRMSYLYIATQFSIYSYVAKAGTSLEARKRLTASYLAAMEFRSRIHRFPATLDEIGADAEDPFAPGTSIRYQTQGNTMKMWSVGPDGKDDHGNPVKQLDIVVEYPFVGRKGGAR